MLDVKYIFTLHELLYHYKWSNLSLLVYRVLDVETTSSTGKFIVLSKERKEMTSA